MKAFNVFNTWPLLGERYGNKVNVMHLYSSYAKKVIKNPHCIK